MKFVIQRVTEASVTADGKPSGKIGQGFLVLVGIGHDDTEAIADKFVKKLIGLRIFEDENGKTNLSLGSVGGELLLISQFTLYADCSHGFLQRAAGNRTFNGTQDRRCLLNRTHHSRTGKRNVSAIRYKIQFSR